MSVRTRFAPSPTGYLHIGGARTALFNHLFTRHEGGAFVLRIEDTDRERSTPAAVEAILEGMRWLKLDWDEGPIFQSDRADLYRQQAARLVAAGRAYWCRCTPEQVEAMRRAAQVAGRKPMYDGTCRDAGHRPDGAPTALRFRAATGGETAFVDLIKGPISFPASELDDLVLVRSDGTPTYNFSAVVDDALMDITHVIRGDDHVANTPKQIQIYEALGFPVPAFAHVPMILGLDRTRLSKRHGATSVTAYREAGYLPDALVNYLVRLGWAHGDQEIFTRAELVDAFSLDGVGAAAGVFNPEKLDWVNFTYLKALTPAELAAEVRPFLRARGYPEPPADWLVAMVATLQERAKTLVELVAAASFYLDEHVDIDPAAADKHLRRADPQMIGALRQGLAELAEWTEEGIKGVFDDVGRRFELKLGKIAQPVRVALTGGTASPGIFEVVAVLGKPRTLERLDRALPLAGTGAPPPP